MGYQPRQHHPCGADRVLFAASSEVAYRERHASPWSIPVVRQWIMDYARNNIEGLRWQFHRAGARRRGPRSLEDKYGKQTILRWYRRAE